MYNVIIFSKDRACQLDACIRSFFFYCKEALEVEISVLYTFSNEEYRRGYILCQQRNNYPNIRWVLQRHLLSFKKDLLCLLKGKETNPYLMFLVDDIIFKDFWSFKDPEIESIKDNPHLLCCSLRLYRGITKCYATNTSSPLPNFIKNNVWSWYGASGDWGYPYSLDGNVYRTISMLPKLYNAEYTNPNQLEAVLNIHNASLVGLGTSDRPLYMQCYIDNSKLVNIPANRVQDEFKNRVGNIMSTEQMNTKYLYEGEQISINTVKDLVNNTVHVEIPIIWEYFRN